MATTPIDDPIAVAYRRRVAARAMASALATLNEELFEVITRDAGIVQQDAHQVASEMLSPPETGATNG